jgi:hypothetical protein
MHAILEAIVGHVRNGHRFEAGERYDAILVRQICAFEAVEHRWLPRYLPEAVAFYGAGGFPALQCLWPDRTGRFPPDRRCDLDVRVAQPCPFPEGAGIPRGGGRRRSGRTPSSPASPR